MKQCLTTLLLLASLAIPAAAQTRPSTLAFVDIERVLSETSAGQEASARIEQMYREYQEQATRMNEDLEKLKQTMDREKHTATGQQRSHREKEFEDNFLALDRFMKDSEARIHEARGKELQQLNARILPLIETIGKETRVHAIFRKSDPAVLYLSDTIPVLDLTDMLIKRMNEGQ